MKQYAAFITGEGEGCDYTIGCNRTFCLIGADNPQEAFDKILESYGQLNPTCDQNIWIDKIELFEINQIFPLFSDLAKRGREKYKEYERKLQEEKELLEYKRLSRKYGKN